MASLDFARDLCDELEKQKFNYLLLTLQKNVATAEYDANNFQCFFQDCHKPMIQLLEEKLKDLKDEAAKATDKNKKQKKKE